MLLAMWMQADVDEGGGEQAVPLAVEDEAGLVGAVVESCASVGSLAETPWGTIQR